MLDKIVQKNQNKLNKNELFDLIYELKLSPEFNSSIYDINKIYKELSELYSDLSPLYQNSLFTDINNLDFINGIFITNKKFDTPVEYKYFDTVLDLFKEAEANSDKKYYIFDDIYKSSDFESLIIPINVFLPIEFVYKTYISDHFYNIHKDIYYKISEDKSFITVLDFKKDTISKIPYSLLYKEINANCIIISNENYVAACNLLLKKIHY